MKKIKLLSILIVIILLFTIITINSYAAFYTDVQSTRSGYSLVGLKVVQVTLHADGYSNSGSGEVTDKWLTVDRCYVPNTVKNKKTWTAQHPSGEYAKGKCTTAVGIDSSKFALSTSGSDWYFSILF